jgi:hypothetical protein
MTWQLRQLPADQGGAGESLFEMNGKCDRCRNWFAEDELKESHTVGGFYCASCWKQEEQEHYTHEDWDGSPFN